MRARAPLVAQDAVGRSGRPLPEEVRHKHELEFRLDLTRISIHNDGAAMCAATELGADAFTLGRHIVFAPGAFSPWSSKGSALLHHELQHAIDQRLADPPRRSEVVMDNAAESAADGHSSRVSSRKIGPFVQRHVAEKVLKRAGSWLEKRSAKLLTKHIANHTRKIAGKALHSIFKNPRKVRPLIEGAVRDAAELVAKNAQAPVTQVLDEGGVRLARQGTGTPGKFRWIVQKTFGESIGTAGERVLRIVIDQSGRLVTAFPADRLVGLAITAAGVEIVTSRTAEAAEAVAQDQRRIVALEKRAAEPEGLSWEDFVPFIGDIHGGSLNLGEDDLLERDRISAQQREFIDGVVNDTIREIEEQEQRSLGLDERAIVEETVRAGIATPFLIEDLEEE